MSEQEILNAQKRALIVELLKFIITLQCVNINLQIKPLVVHVYMQLKEIGLENKGIITLLSLYGDPGEIIEEIQAQNLQQQVLIAPGTRSLPSSFGAGG